MWKICGLMVVAALWLFGIGCGGDDSSCEGEAGCACRSDGTCDPGLVCYQNVCRRPTCVGQEGCQCRSDGTCNPGLECVQGMCRRPGPQPTAGGPPPPPPTNGLPEICAPVVGEWDAVCEIWEGQLIEDINARRAAGATCGAQGALPPAPALVVSPNLECAARLNSKEIIEVGDLEAQAATKPTALIRAQLAGYEDIKVGEHVATNYAVDRVVNTWMESEVSCANLMDPGYAEIGAGCYQIPNADIATVSLFLAWTVQLGGPAPPPEW